MRFQAIHGSALFVTLAGVAAAVWGWVSSNGLEAERAVAFVIGLVAAVFGSIVWRSAASVRRQVAELRDGRGLGGRWFIRPEAVAEFLDYERQRGVANEWRPSWGERRRGVDVLWGGDNLVVGGTYWRIAPGQYPEIEAVGLDPGPPLTVAVRYRQLWFVTPSSRARSIPTVREFRFPVIDIASARAMVSLFALNLAREAGVDPRKAGRFFRGALILAVLFAAAGLVGLGFAVQDNMAGIRRPDGERAMLIAMVVVAAMGTPAALAIAFLARRLRGR
ncbi:MAG: hypothetical protein WBR13_03615 [Allosphingosinicella sp.]